MKPLLLATLTVTGLLMPALADSVKKPPTETEKAQALIKHQKGSEQISYDQDEQSANVQELLAEQTNPQVIDLLSQVQILMAQATDRLEDANTDGDTIAIQTEIIEKIYAAAKAKNNAKKKGKSPNMGAMLEMMGQMMGKSPGKKPAKKTGESQKGGEATQSESNSANTDNKGKNNTQGAKERRVPRAAGKSGTKLPPEFQKALDGYNKKSKNN